MAKQIRVNIPDELREKAVAAARELAKAVLEADTGQPAAVAVVRKQRHSIRVVVDWPQGTVNVALMNPGGKIIAAFAVHPDPGTVPVPTDLPLN